MNYWIFVVTSREPNLSGREIYRLRMEDQFWGLGKRTPNRKNLEAGDQVVFYVGRPEMVFAGTARLASDPFHLTSEQRNQYGHGLQQLEDEYGVSLTDIEPGATSALWKIPTRPSPSCGFKRMGNGTSPPIRNGWGGKVQLIQRISSGATIWNAPHWNRASGGASSSCIGRNRNSRPTRPPIIGALW